jgi:peptidoglycan/xylan/chitin deacetylase (PgdA/CDA1 family)
MNRARPSTLKSMLCGLLLLLPACRRELPVLLYHEVGCGTDDVRDVPVREFATQMAYLADHGYTFVSLAALADAWDGKKQLPSKPVAVTFDDGAACVFSQAFPVLESHGIPFALFLPSQWIAADDAQRHRDSLDGGIVIPTITWPETKQMAASGLAQIEAHGQTHLHLRHADDATVQREVTGARDDLAKSLGSAPEFFAYPFGAFDQRTLDAVRAAGYRAAFAVGTGLGGRFAYRRHSIHRGLSDQAFAESLRGDWILPLLNHD